jgi:phosphate uptake regulator
MRRKVVQHGPSSLIVSLPSRWVRAFDIKKGDEVEVIEKGNELKISTGSVVKGKAITVDITDLNKTSIIIYLQSMYRYGYDEINVQFRNAKAYHHRKEESIPVLDILNEVISYFIGVEIVKQTENYVQIKQIAEDSEKDFDVLIKRVVFLAMEAFQEFEKAIRSNDLDNLNLMVNYHTPIIKFINYCMRLLNRGTVRDLSDSLTLYHLLAVIDKIVDLLREAARIQTDKKTPLSKFKF